MSSRRAIIKRARLTKLGPLNFYHPIAWVSPRNVPPAAVAADLSPLERTWLLRLVVDPADGRPPERRSFSAPSLPRREPRGLASRRRGVHLNSSRKTARQRPAARASAKSGVRPVAARGGRCRIGGGEWFGLLSGSFGEKPAASGEKPETFGEKPGASGEKPGSSGEKPGASGEISESSGEKPGASGEIPGASGESGGSEG
jgi:hypothetical protein